MSFPDLEDLHRKRNELFKGGVHGLWHSEAPLHAQEHHGGEPHHVRSTIHRLFFGNRP